MNKGMLCAIVLLSISIVACNNQNKSKTESFAVESNLNQKTIEMKSHISIFEIPAAVPTQIF